MHTTNKNVFIVHNLYNCGYKHKYTYVINNNNDNNTNNINNK